MLPAGKYYIGDLCYVIADWDKFCEMTIVGHNCLDGEFNFMGTPIASYGTLWGDGEYRDQTGNRYSVDAGLIGCIPVDKVTKPDGLNFGRVVEFTNDFNTSSVNGVITFGGNSRDRWNGDKEKVVIDTSEENIEDEDESDRQTEDELYRGGWR